mmetsp:Transcript_2418/g.4790  ORF Transcript_2418/g.4790 Transcript_2418/m.4790 type:complete len:200 (-) Transcript_2418:3-602(-)
MGEAAADTSGGGVGWDLAPRTPFLSGVFAQRPCASVGFSPDPRFASGPLGESATDASGGDGAPIRPALRLGSNGRVSDASGTGDRVRHPRAPLPADCTLSVESLISESESIAGCCDCWLAAGGRALLVPSRSRPACAVLRGACSDTRVVAELSFESVTANPPPHHCTAAPLSASSNGAGSTSPSMAVTCKVCSAKKNIA